MRLLFSRFFCLLCVCLSLASCGFHPAYQDLSQETYSLAALEALDVSPQSTRLGQIIRNRLLASKPNGVLKAPLYRLALMTPLSEEEPAVQVLDTSTLRTRFKLSVTFDLFDLKTHKKLYSDRVFSIVSYDRVVPSFANGQALMAAQERAAEEIALGIRMKLLAYSHRSR